MTVWCAACQRKTGKVKTVKGYAPCCSSWNSLVKTVKSKPKPKREKR